MPSYHIEVASSAAKEFRSLPVDLRHQVAMSIDALNESPRPSGVRELYPRLGLHRIRVGTYSLVYRIDDEARQILVTAIVYWRRKFGHPEPTEGGSAVAAD
jgi:mRNA-degrading endonuclease RelE of RelBE toxin-antitoxin system